MIGSGIFLLPAYVVTAALSDELQYKDSMEFTRLPCSETLSVVNIDRGYKYVLDTKDNGFCNINQCQLIEQCYTVDDTERNIVDGYSFLCDGLLFLRHKIDEIFGSYVGVYLGHITDNGNLSLTVNIVCDGDVSRDVDNYLKLMDVCVKGLGEMMGSVIVRIVGE